MVRDYIRGYCTVERNGVKIKVTDKIEVMLNFLQDRSVAEDLKSKIMEMILLSDCMEPTNLGLLGLLEQFDFLKKIQEIIKIPKDCKNSKQIVFFCKPNERKENSSRKIYSDIVNFLVRKKNLHTLCQFLKLVPQNYFEKNDWTELSGTIQARFSKERVEKKKLQTEAKKATFYLDTLKKLEKKIETFKRLKELKNYYDLTVTTQQ